MSVAQEPQPDITIRARPPSPKRLSRNVLLATTAGAGLVIAVALVSGLSGRHYSIGPHRRAGTVSTCT